MTLPRQGISAHPIQSVVVVGGGLAGLSASCALADSGFRVQLIERRPYLGGRASSYRHPGTEEVIDNCQHVLLGHCVNLLDLYRRLGVGQAVRWFDRLTFLEPGGARSVVQPSLLPAPFHSAPSFLRARAFSLADKLAIARGMSAFLRGLPPDSEGSFDGWLARHGQTRGAIEHFWKPVMISALNEDLDCISTHYAGQVIRKSLLCSPAAGRMGIPVIPLSDLYGRAVDYLQARGGRVELRAAACGFELSEHGRQWSVRTEEKRFTADAVIFALAFENMSRLLPALPENPEADKLKTALAQFAHSPITGIHLWFDREITDLDHAILLDATIQWIFHKSRLQPERRGRAGSYVELVVSASKSMVDMPRQQIIDLALRELAGFIPAAAFCSTFLSEFLTALISGPRSRAMDSLGMLPRLRFQRLKPRLNIGFLTAIVMCRLWPSVMTVKVTTTTASLTNTMTPPEDFIWWEPKNFLFRVLSFLLPSTPREPIPALFMGRCPSPTLSPTKLS